MSKNEDYIKTNKLEKNIYMKTESNSPTFLTHLDCPIIFQNKKGLRYWNCASPLKDKIKNIATPSKSTRINKLLNYNKTLSSTIKNDQNQRALFKNKLLNDLKFLNKKVNSDISDKTIDPVKDRKIYVFGFPIDNKILKNITNPKPQRIFFNSKYGKDSSSLKDNKTKAKNKSVSYFSHKNKKSNQGISNVKDLQQIYYNLDKDENNFKFNKDIEKDEKKNNYEEGRYIKWTFSNYAIKNDIYNHPQLYMINENNKNKNHLPNIQNRSNAKELEITDLLNSENEYEKMEKNKINYNCYKKIKSKRKPNFCV